MPSQIELFIKLLFMVRPLVTQYTLALIACTNISLKHIGQSMSKFLDNLISVLVINFASCLRTYKSDFQTLLCAAIIFHSSLKE